MIRVRELRSSCLPSVSHRLPVISPFKPLGLPDMPDTKRHTDTKQHIPRQVNLARRESVEGKSEHSDTNKVGGPPPTFPVSVASMSPSHIRSRLPWIRNGK
jgi:hypothetical protein